MVPPSFEEAEAEAAEEEEEEVEAESEEEAEVELFAKRPLPPAPPRFDRILVRSLRRFAAPASAPSWSKVNIQMARNWRKDSADCPLATIPRTC